MYFDLFLSCHVFCFIILSLHPSVPGAVKEVSEPEKLFV